jgi:C4-type Zn-finger protein
MDVQIRHSVTAQITLDETEQFRATIEQGNRPAAVMIRGLHVWADWGPYASGRITRVEGRGVLIRRDGTIGRAERARLSLRMEQLPSVLREAILALPVPEGRDI